MTQAQVQYLANLEQARHNREMEMQGRQTIANQSITAEASKKSAEASQLSAKANMQKSNVGILNTAVGVLTSAGAAALAARKGKKTVAGFAGAAKTATKLGDKIAKVASKFGARKLTKTAVKTAATSFSLPALGITFAIPTGVALSGTVLTWLRQQKNSDTALTQPVARELQQLVNETNAIDSKDSEAVKQLKIKWQEFVNKMKGR